MEIREMLREDIPQVARLWDQGWHDAHAKIVPQELVELRTLDSFEARLADKMAAVRVNVVDDHVLGFCITQRDELYQMYVSPNARGTGLAQVLIADAERRIMASGYETAWLACAVGNNRAARFYTKSGWFNAGVEDVNLDTSEGIFPLPVWRFEKQLKSQISS